MRKAGRIVLAMLLGLVAAELLLRAAGWAYLALHRRGPAATVGEGAILCVGDSNTFGLYLTPEDSYPAKLGKLLPGGPEVVNLGIPGMGADHVARNLPEQLERYRPSVVLALAGVNNTWSQTGWRDSALARFVSELRLVKVVLLFGARDELSASKEAPQAANSAEGGAEFRGTDDAMGLLEYRRSSEPAGGGGSVFRIENRAGEKVTFVQPNNKLAGGDFHAAIENRMESAIELCRARGVAPVLLTYPFDVGPLPEINETLRRVAARSNVLLVDLEAELAPYVRDLGLEELAFPDGHPRALGTAVMAAAIQRALVAAQLVAAEPAPMPTLDELRAGSDARPRTLRQEGDVLVAEGRHGDAVHLVFSDARGDQKAAGFATGLGPSELFKQSLRNSAMHLPIGPEGRVELKVPGPARKAAAKGPVFVQALYGPQNADGAFQHASDVIELGVSELAPAPAPGGDPPR